MEITKLSSKGQIVIPEKIRRGFKEGTPFLVTELDDLIVLKKIPEITKDEMETLRGIKKAWDDLSAGRGKIQKVDDFLRDIKKW